MSFGRGFKATLRHGSGATPGAPIELGRGEEVAIGDVFRGGRCAWRVRYLANHIAASSAPTPVVWGGAKLRIRPHHQDFAGKTFSERVWGFSDLIGEIDNAGAPLTRTPLNGIAPQLQREFYYEIDLLPHSEFYAPFNCSLSLYSEYPLTVAYDIVQDDRGPSREDSKVEETDFVQEYTWSVPWMPGQLVQPTVSQVVDIPFPLGSHEFAMLGTITNTANAFSLLYDDFGTVAGAGTSVVPLDFAVRRSSGFSGRLPIANARALRIDGALIGGPVVLVAYVRIR